MDILVFLADNTGSILTIIAALAPLIGLIITYIKKKLSDDQGDSIIGSLESFSNQVSVWATVLSPYIPELKTIADDLANCVASAKKLWEDPTNNSAELVEVLKTGSDLFATALALVQKYITANKAVVDSASTENTEAA